MANAASGGAPKVNLRFHRLAEQVADHLRGRILSGELADGELLPKEEGLRADYPVSKPSLREAMRILEAEGLISVRRGNVGGAVVHRPTPANVASALGLVLGSYGVKTSDVAGALREVEPACAALCAQRKDRAKAVVPVLKRLHKECLASVEDLVAEIAASRRYHEALVELCGNRTLIVMAGALEAIWSSHEAQWADTLTEHSEISLDERLAVLEEHAAVIAAIADGDAALARDLAAAHLRRSQTYPGGDRLIDQTLVRERMAPRSS